MRKIKTDIRTAFSLMEMMIVLLIISIIAAASAPMVSKKLSRDTGSSDNPWTYTSLNGTMAYNINGSNDQTAIIGRSSVPQAAGNPRLYIDGQNGIAFGNGGNYTGSISLGNGGNITIGNGATVPEVANRNIAIGTNAQALGDRSIAIGFNTENNAQNGRFINTGNRSLTIGSGLRQIGNDSISLGFSDDDGGRTVIIGRNAIGIGRNVLAEDFGIAIGGTDRSIAGVNSVAIGTDAQTGSENHEGQNCIAIGAGASTPNDTNNAVQIGNGNITNVKLGGNSTELNVHSIRLINGVDGDNNNPLITYDATNNRININGTLRVNALDCDSLFADTSIWVRSGTSDLYNNVANSNGDTDIQAGTKIPEMEIYTWIGPQNVSDRRLKNVGEKFTDGLDALKKLDLFHYTFKEDKNKTPHVGVMAQDLQKVFPNAVITGEDGYLRIRLEDMFYAVINAVKELDTRISEVINQVKANVDEITKLRATVNEQQKTIDELKAQNAEFEKRLARLEKANGVKEVKVKEPKVKEPKVKEAKAKK